MMAGLPHIDVCVCTYKRTRYLAYLLERLSAVDTGDLFTYSIVVVDNDRSRSAEPVVASFEEVSSLYVQYLVEPRQNIALARNMAVRTGRGEFIAFIDDDEYPAEDWLR